MKFFATSFPAIVVLASSAFAKQLEINTPVDALECVPTQITWTGGTGPFSLTIRTPDADGEILQTFNGLTDSPFLWPTDVGAGTQCGLALADRSDGEVALSGPFIIGESGDSSCLKSGAAVPVSRR